MTTSQGILGALGSKAKRLSAGAIAALWIFAAVEALALEPRPCAELPRSMIVTKAPYRPIASEPATSPQSLERLMRERKAEVERVLAANGLGLLIQPLYEALGASKVRLRRLTRGETVEWLAQLDPTSGDIQSRPACALPSQPIDVWEISVTSIAETIEPGCEISARRADNTVSRVLIDATKLDPLGDSWAETAAGETVATATAGTITEFTDPNPYLTKYRVRARAKARVAEVTHRFLVLANGLNIGLSSSETTARAEERTCPEVFVGPVASQDPFCRLTVGPRESLAGEAVEVTGTWEPANSNPSPKVEVSEGRAIVGPFPQQRVFVVPGRFTLRSRARNERAEVSECSEEIVVRPRWRARLSGLGAIGTDLGYVEQPKQAEPPTQGASASTSGWQGRLSVERLVNETVGLVAGFSGGSLKLPWRRAQEDPYPAEEWRDHRSASLRQADLGANLHFPGTARLDVILGLFVGAVHLSEFREPDPHSGQAGRPAEQGGGATYFAWGTAVSAELAFPHSCWAAFGEIRIRDIPARSPHGEIFEFGLGAALRF